jgi:N-acetylglutamate synthase
LEHAVISEREIKLFEELNLNAWPALGQVILNGWVVRFSEGYSRRANSANAIAPGNLEPSVLIPQFEEHFRRCRLRSCVRMTPLVPDGFWEELNRRRYASEAETIVMRADIRGGESSDDVIIAPKANYEWLRGYEQTNPRTDFNASTLGKILGVMVPETAFALFHDGRQPVSFAIGVLERGHLAVLNVATHPEARRRGHSKRVLQNLYAWAKARDAHTAHLNVQADNTPAVTLYSSLGFSEIYRYVYRVKELT